MKRTYETRCQRESAALNLGRDTLMFRGIGDFFHHEFLCAGFIVRKDSFFGIGTVFAYIFNCIRSEGGTAFGSGN
ncbi:hypothetical protein [Paenibacillus periandrae]|uniref:hypothetical protein n=1 Tax=Paenibacillus periandrae TaxID=1761741 RepID=UPI001F09513E|nr:hypothetical protein [Paenibacillus periandrae]